MQGVGRNIGRVPLLPIERSRGGRAVVFRLTATRFVL